MNFNSEYAKVLKEGFEQKYNKEISIDCFLAEYCQSTNDEVSYETIRRWLRGLNMPNFHRLCLIAAWLDLDLNAFILVVKKKT